MPRAQLACALTLLLASLAYPTIGHAAWPSDPAVNVPICRAIGDQFPLAACADGVGGMFIAWSDTRSGPHDLFATHLSSQGVIVAGWPVNGLAVCTASGDQTNPAVVPDGAGGVIVIWQDGRVVGNADIYAERLTATGTVASGWPSLAANGVLLCGAANKQLSPVAASDGAGGAIVAWQDLRNGVDNNIYAQRVLANGVIAPGWSPNGDSLCVAAGNQTTPSITADGAGGAYVAWSDARGTNLDVYAQHITGAGAIASGWPSAVAGGLAITTAAMDDDVPTIASDDVGGAYVSWFSSGTDVWRAQRVTATGNTVIGWPSAASGGLSLGVTSNLIGPPAILADGTGGAIVAVTGGATAEGFAVHVGAGEDAAVDWTSSFTSPDVESTGGCAVGDGFGGVYIVVDDAPTGDADALDLYAIHFTSSGALAAGWSSAGIPLATARSFQAGAVAVPDGAGGFIAAWADLRDSVTTGVDLYAQRVERFGHLGDPGPQIASVRDVPNDQGGAVRVAWNASVLDAYPAFAVSSYHVWRQVPASVAESALRRGARLWSGDGVAPPGPAPVLRTARTADQAFYWELIANQPAFGLTGYSLVAATVGDSVAASNPTTAFEVQAISGSEFWFSAPDSGYSVDNLPPAVPTGFTGTFVSGSGAFIAWSNNAEPDLAGYRLYRGSTAGFVPTSGDRIAALTSPGYTDAGSSPAYYKLSAYDIHGNESGFALLLPQGTTSVGTGRAAVFALDEPRPNPARAGALALSFALPSDAPASLEVIDASGRARLTRDVGVLGVGPHVVSIGSEQKLEPGLYFVRLIQGEHRAIRRVAIIE